MVKCIPVGSPVLVYCTECKRWKGPFQFMSIENKTGVVQLDRGRNIFCSPRFICFVIHLMDGDCESTDGGHREFYTSTSNSHDQSEEDEKSREVVREKKVRKMAPNDAVKCSVFGKRGLRQTWKRNIFVESRAVEIQSLINN